MIQCSPQPGLGVEDWLEGSNVSPPKISLDPAKRGSTLAHTGPAIPDIPRKVKIDPSAVNTANTVTVSNMLPTITTSNNSVVTSSTNGVKPSPKPRVSRKLIFMSIFPTS